MSRNKIDSLSEGVHTISDQTIIRDAWGPRRASSRKRGMELLTYPKSVTASKSLWLFWLDSAPTEQALALNVPDTKNK